LQPKIYKKRHVKLKPKTVFLEKLKFKREGITVIVIGFTSVGLFLIIYTWFVTFAVTMIVLSESQSINLLSIYSSDGFNTVIILATLLARLFKPVTILIISPVIAIISLVSLLVVENYYILVVIAFMLGLSTSGLFQLAVTLMAQF